MDNQCPFKFITGECGWSKLSGSPDEAKYCRPGDKWPLIACVNEQEAKRQEEEANDKEAKVAGAIIEALTKNYSERQMPKVKFGVDHPDQPQGGEKEIKCMNCNGSGYTPSPATVCIVCKGTGVIIPLGKADGEKDESCPMYNNCSKSPCPTIDEQVGCFRENDQRTGLSDRRVNEQPTILATRAKEMQRWGSYDPRDRRDKRGRRVGD